MVRAKMARFAPVLIFLVAFIAFAVGIADVPVIDRDEARFAQAARQMVETGDYIDIRFHDGPRHNKPIGIYWLQAGMLHLFATDGIWVHRLVSVMAAALAVLATMWAGRPLVGQRAALWGGIVLASIFMVHAEARLAKTDAALLLSIIVAMGALARVWTNGVVKPSVAAVFWTSLAVGFLIKGPIILMPVGGAVLWCSARAGGVRWMAGLRPVWGVAWALALIVPWYAAIIWRTEGGFLTDSLIGDLTNKITTRDEADGTPPGTYLIAFWFTFWPWVILAPMAALWAWQNRRETAVAFLFGWIIPTWVIFEIVPTKLIHYTLPTYPAVALICGAVLTDVITGKIKFQGWPAHVGLTLAGVVGIAFIALALVAPRAWGDEVHPLAIIGAISAGFMGIMGAVWLYRAQTIQAAIAIALSGVVMMGGLFALTLPSLSQLWIAPRLQQALVAHACLRGPVTIVGFHEPSTIFTFGRDTRLDNVEGALAYLAHTPNAAAWIPAADLAALGIDPTGGIADVTEVRGINYSNGRHVILRLVVSPGRPAPTAPCD
mgnify:CR=1 FL=1